MGLDSYLRKCPYVHTWKSQDKVFQEATKVDVTVRLTYPDGSTDVEDFGVEKPSSGVEIKLPVAYWRKANAIHRWFIDHLADGVDDCKPISVSGAALIELRDVCEQILKDHSKACELLPTQNGFFFGSTEYDEFYFNDIQHTVDCLRGVTEDGIYEYQASW